MLSLKNICQSLTIMSLLSLVGCGPMYNTTYSYIPPHSATARMCTMQCAQTKSMCQQMCQMQDENCRVRAREEARWRYEDYARERRYRGVFVDKRVSDFDTGYSCSSSCNCENDYRSCFTSCGGQVLAHQQCVAFCDRR